MWDQTLGLLQYYIQYHHGACIVHIVDFDFAFDVALSVCLAPMSVMPTQPEIGTIGRRER